MKKNNHIHIGYCSHPHGIKGEFTFVLFNTEDSVLESQNIIFIKPKNSNSSINLEGDDFKISKIKFGNKVIASLEGVNDRNIVEKMIPFDIYVRREQLVPTDEDEFYLCDLIDLDVFDFNSKKKIGKIVDFYENGAQVVLKIKSEQDILEILFIDQFVKEVDIENNKMEVIIPEIVE